MSALPNNQHTTVNAVGGAVTMTLPTGQVAGSKIGVEKIDTSANTVTVTGSIRGTANASLALALQFEAVQFIADSSGSWWPTAGHKTLGSLDSRFASAYPGKASLCARGDSLTFSSGTDWPGVAAAALGISYINRGQSGWASTDIALLAGALDLTVTATSNQIPASGPVTLTSVTAVSSSFRVDGTGDLSWTGTLAGVPGSVTHVHSTGVWTFTRTTSGSVVSCPAGSTFHCSADDIYRDWMQTLWVGRNNFTTACVPTDVIRDTDLMLRRMLGRRFLVLGMTNTSSETSAATGTNLTNYQAIVQINSWLATRHSSQYLDVRSALIARGMDVMGLPKTTQDVTDIATDTIPSSLHVDTIHLTADGYTFVGLLVAEKMRQLGWVSGAYPTAPPATPAGFTAGTATTTTQPFTWTTAADTTGWTVEVKLHSASTYGPGTASKTPSGTVTGLLPSTAYDYRLTAHNIGGDSTSVVLSNVTTASTPPTLLVSDGFSGTDGALLNARSTDNAGGTGSLGTLAWTSDAQLAIEGNALGAASLSSTRLGRLNISVSDMRVSSKLSVLAGTTSADGNGVIARHTDASNYYKAIVNGDGSSGLYKRASGTTTVIGNPGTFAAGDTIDLSVQGTTITVYKNGVQVLQVSDTTSVPTTTGTNGGVISAFSTASFRMDDLKIYDH